MTKEEFDQYDEDNDEILEFNEWMSLKPSSMRLLGGIQTLFFIPIIPFI